MDCFLSPCVPAGGRGFSSKNFAGRAGKLEKTVRSNAKSRRLPVWKPQLQRPMKPQPINALNALRDGASCSEELR